MDILLCLVGKSGSGKSTIAMEMEKEGVNVIQSYTTRPERHQGEWGHTFANEELFFTHKEKNIVIAETKIKGYYYWATSEQYKGKGVSLYVIDPHGVEVLKKTVNDPIISAYVCVPYQERLKRLIKQHGSTEEALNRLERDKGAFGWFVPDEVILNLDLDIALKMTRKIITELQPIELLA